MRHCQMFCAEAGPNTCELFMLVSFFCPTCLSSFLCSFRSVSLSFSLPLSFVLSFLLCYIDKHITQLHGRSPWLGNYCSWISIIFPVLAFLSRLVRFTFCLVLMLSDRRFLLMFDTTRDDVFFRADILPTTTFQDIMKQALIEKDTEGWETSWVVRYSVVVKSRGIIKGKGYLVKGKRDLSKVFKTQWKKTARWCSFSCSTSLHVTFCRLWLQIFPLEFFLIICDTFNFCTFHK